MTEQIKSEGPNSDEIDYWNGGYYDSQKFNPNVSRAVRAF
ncbi:MAG: hypothetical protein ACI87H_001673 [Gammaproteobacteria bacterium]|jgi:hypothetical protein